MFFSQIGYLEFLSTSEFNLGLHCPRIHVWSTTIVKAMALLDCTQGEDKKFGRLQGYQVIITTFQVNTICIHILIVAICSFL